MAQITKEQIQAVADKIAKEFSPEKIILFGSYAWGKPHEDSDVDLLIVKDIENTRTLARKIDDAIDPRSFAMDILVYTPASLEKKILHDGNLFLGDVMKHGIKLYEHH